MERADTGRDTADKDIPRRVDPVVIRGDNVGVQSRRDDVGVAAARRRFGGIDIPATLAGTMAALGTAVLLGSLLAAAGSFGYQRGIKDADTLSIGGLVAGLVTLLIAFLVGGWVAGRMARYDGGRNGLLTVVWFLLLAAATSALGAWLGAKYDVFSNLRLPQWFSRNALTTAALVSGLLALAVMLLAGWLGGRLGSRYHARADRLISQTRDGGVGVPATVQPRGGLDASASHDARGTRPSSTGTSR